MCGVFGRRVFPKDVAEKKLWTKRLKLVFSEVTDKNRICNKHFNTNDLILTKNKKGKVRYYLQEGTLPLEVYNQKLPDVTDSETDAFDRIQQELPSTATVEPLLEVLESRGRHPVKTAESQETRVTRKAGTGPVVVNDEGKDINPHPIVHPNIVLLLSWSTLSQSSVSSRRRKKRHCTHRSMVQ
uniref:Uncharacterized protein n=1 Tax=Phlebotomus papatasi TaxID=29031 RepID=A0A1B0EX89_PHLPP